MRITACRMEAFGPFRARTFNGLDYPVVVVQGPNEAGKTSLFHFFREMLYGIEPPDAARHPYAPVDGQRPLEGQVRYRLSGGTRRTVHRRLVSVPQARLVEANDGQPVDLQNRPLPAVAHISREVFSSVYALSGRTLSGLRGTVWEEVQARLLRMMDAPNVRSPGEAAAELEEEAARLWAPPEAEAETDAAPYAARRRTLRQQLKRAQAHDRKRRSLHQAIAEHTARLEALEAEREELKARLRQAERLRPVHALVSKMEAHAERAGDLTPFEAVPKEPEPVLRRLDREIDRYEQEAARNEQARSEAQATRDAFTDADRRVRGKADAIRAWGKRAAAHENRTAHREQLLRDIEQINDVLTERAEHLFGVSWSDSLADALSALPEEELDARVEAYREAASEVDALQVRADTLARKVDRRKRLWPWLTAAGAGLVAFVLGLVLGREILWGASTGVVAVGFLQVLNAWNYNRERTERLGDLDLEIEEKTEARAEKSAAIAELLDDLPLAEEEAARPGHELVDALHDMRRQLEERSALRRQVQTLAETLEEAEEAVAALAQDCGLDRSGEAGSLPETVATLEKRLDAAEARHREAEAAEARLAELRRRQREIEPALQERRERRQALNTRLLELEDDPDAAIEELKVRREAARRAEQVRETLFREHPGWEALREEIRAVQEDANTWTYTDADVVRMKERREAVTDEIVETEKQRTRKREEAERLSRAPAPADVESKLAAAERRLEATGRRRDRLALLANVLRRADRTFHRKRQPDVVKQAGRYLCTITAGRYDRLVLEGEEDRRLHVCRSGTEEAQPVAAPLSQGLHDQVYVALRLALLDHLDQSQETLPVFLDEVFAGWDRHRRQQGYAVIEELAERRQVFVFTCHPALSEELHRGLDAHRVLLDAPAKEEASEPEKAAST